MRQRITIQQNQRTKDGVGQYLNEWFDVATVWARLTAANGKEIFAASGFTSQVSHIARIRFDPSLTVSAGMRVLYDGRAFDVTSAADIDGLRQTLSVTLLQRGDGTP